MKTDSTCLLFTLYAGCQKRIFPFSHFRQCVNFTHILLGLALLEKFSTLVDTAISKAFHFLVKSRSFISINEEPYRCFERLQWLNANENNNIFVQPKLCLVESIESQMNSLHPINCKTQGHIVICITLKQFCFI